MARVAQKDQKGARPEARGSAADAIWAGGVISATAQARYAAHSQRFGFDRGNGFNLLFDVQGYGMEVTGSASVDLSNDTWRWVRRKQDNTNTWYSDPLWNHDGLDHMVTCRVTGLDTNETVWLLFWEDLPKCSSDRDTWPFLLEEHLRSLGYDVEVVNAGQPWFTTARSLTNYAVQMRHLDPDVVIVMHAVNDLCRSFPGAYGLPPEWDYGSSVGPMDDLFHGRTRSNRGAANAYRPPLCVIWTFICAVTEVDSKYYSAFRTVTEEARSSPRSSRTPSQKRMPGGTTPLVDRVEADVVGIREVDVGLEAFTSLESFRSHLDYLVELVQAHGALVMVCMQAHMYHRPVADRPENLAHTLRYEFFGPTTDACITPDSLRRAMAAARDIILDIAHLRGALLLDVEALIHDDASCFLDGVHLMGEGNDRIARAMADRLAPALDALSPSRDVKTP